MKHIRIGFLLATLTTLTVFTTLAQTLPSNYDYFPHPAADNGNLALTAQGDNVKMTYTPATYQIVKTEAGKNIELQIQDALLESGINSEDVNNNGTTAKMALVFASSANNWNVKCNDVVVAKNDQPAIIIDTSICGFKGQKQWSDVLTIDIGSSNSLLMKTIWDDTLNGVSKDSSYSDLINVFKFRFKHGEIDLAPTDVEAIGTGFRTSRDLAEYSNKLNWAVLYNTDTSADFEFFIDANDTDEIILFDKDADASKLHGESSPNDPGITMNVTWDDGSPVTRYPNWTKFDQRNEADFRDPLPRPLSGETNSYTGPSGDTGNNTLDAKSMQWYKIPVSAHKTPQIKVTWSGFAAHNNAFGFASSKALRPPCQNNCDILKPSPGISFVLSSNPLPGNTVKDGQQIDYTLWLKNETDHELTHVRFFMDAPSLTIKTGGDNIYELDTIAPHGSFEEANRRSLSVKVNSTAKTATISSEGYFALSADQFSEKIFALPIYHYIDYSQPPSSPSDPSSPSNPFPPLCTNLDCPPPDICTEANGCKNPLPPPPPPARAGDPECTESENKQFRVCITADPLPNTYGLKPGDTISYLISITNESNIQNLEGLKLHFQNPDGTQSQTTNYELRTIPIIPPNSSLTSPISLPVIIQDIGEQNFTISTKDKITITSPGLAQLVLPEILHHVGQGDITVDRCVNLDGEPNCEPLENNKEITLEPGRLINIVDIVTNNRSSAYSKPYFPIALDQERLLYQANSIYRVKSWSSVSDILRNFNDPFPDPEPGVFPPKNGISLGSIPPQQQRAIHFQYSSIPTDEEKNCFTVDLPNAGESSTICVAQEKDDPIEVRLQASPAGKPDGQKIAAGEVITYTLTAANYSRIKTVDSLSFSAPRPEGTCCLEANGSCRDTGDTCPLLTTITTLDHGQSLSVSYLVKVLKNPENPLKEVFNEGVTVNYGEQLVQKTNSISHSIDNSPKPLANFYHDIELTRRTVLNSADGKPRSDQADVSVIHHEFGFAGTQKNFPQLLQENTRPQPYKEYWCFDRLKKSYDAPWGSSLLVYNSKNRSPTSSNSSVWSDDLTFEITTTIPDAGKRPGFKMITGNAANETFTDSSHTFTIAIKGSDKVNQFMRNGQKFTSDQINMTKFRAVQDGIGGKIETRNTVKTSTQVGKVSEDIWRYIDTGTSEYLGRCGCGNNCSYAVYAPVYEWSIDPQDPISLSAEDSDIISVYTSSAWLETHRGNFGIDKILHYDSQLDNPNFVPLADRNILTAPKDYAPPGSFNAEQLIFLQNGSDDNLSSEINNGKKYLSGPLQLGFIPSPTKQGAVQLARGDAYDRSAHARDFERDLLVHQLYGKVVTITGNTIYTGSQNFTADTIYHIKGTLTIDGPSAFTILGGKARLYVDGDVFINSNIKYGSNSGALETIPSLRIHTKSNLFINGSVTQLELMMLVGGEFHSGKSKNQLTIVGDVIADKAFLERQPLVYDPKISEKQQAVNRPAEIIYEDYRKYLLPPPGDQQLPDFGNIWKEVNVDNGEGVDWEKFTVEIKN